MRGLDCKDTKHVRREPIFGLVTNPNLRLFSRKTHHCRCYRSCHTLFFSPHAVSFSLFLLPARVTGTVFLNGEWNDKKKRTIWWIDAELCPAYINSHGCGTAVGECERCPTTRPECRGKQTLRAAWKHLEVITEERSLLLVAIRRGYSRSQFADANCS